MGLLRTPTDLEQESVLHYAIGYDPQQAHAYYLRNRQLKGRKKGSAQPPRSSRVKANPQKTEQKVRLQASITNLQKKLSELEQLIQQKEAVVKRNESQAKSKARKERSAKEKNKPQTAAEKAKAARENQKYRDKHKQELKTKAKQASGKSGGGSHQKGAVKPREMPIKDLKSLATKVRGQIAIAKQKLAAL